MSKHSPGPWELDDLGYKQIVSAPGNGYITRDVCRLDGSTMAAFEQKANARLIAAAPDLLSALIMVLDDPQALDGRPRTAEVVRKAIAKAIGEPT